MKFKLSLLLILCFISAFLFSSGCVSEEISQKITSASEGEATNAQLNPAITMTKGSEKISLEVGQPYYDFYPYGERKPCEPGTNYCKLYLPMKVKNVGNVGIKTLFVGGSLTDYAGFDAGQAGVSINGMYPGEEKAIINEVEIGDLNDPHIQNKISHDLSLNITFGNDSTTWTISTVQIRTST